MCSDCGGDIRSDHFYDPDIRKGAYGYLYQDTGAGGIKPGYDGNSCGRIRGDGGDAVSFRCDERCGGYYDAYVDIDRHNDFDSCAHRLRNFVPYQDTGAAERKAGVYFHLIVSFLGDRRTDYICFLQTGEVEREGNLENVPPAAACF